MYAFVYFYKYTHTCAIPFLCCSGMQECLSGVALHTGAALKHLCYQVGGNLLYSSHLV